MTAKDANLVRELAEALDGLAELDRLMRKYDVDCG